MRFDDMFNLLYQKSIEYDIHKKELNSNKIKLLKERSLLRNTQNARAIIIQIGEKTQTEIKTYIEETVTLALQSVYGEDYKFIIDFDYSKRDQFEVYFFVEHLGIKLEPRKDTLGGGIIDVCSFALRLVCLTLENKDISSILILDEPFKNVSEKFIPSVGAMIVDIANMLDLQIIMVTHVDGFIESAQNNIHL